MELQPRNVRADVTAWRAVIVGLVLAAGLLMVVRTGLAQGSPHLVRRHLARGSATPSVLELTYNSVRNNAYWDVSIMDVTSGTTRRISHQPFFVMACDWTHDGSRLAFMTDRDGNFEIYSMAADGSDWRRITNSSGDDYGPEWSPDGRHLAYAEDLGGTLQVFVAEPDGSNRVQLTSGASGGSSPVWSPDGRQIAFVSGTSVETMDSDGKYPVTVVSDAADKLPTDWSPDGTHILFMSKQNGIFKLHTLRLADGVVEPLDTGAYDAWDGRWSPDGSLIAFYSYGPNSQGFSSGLFAVFLMNADGSNMRQLTTRTASDRSWHPTWGP